MRVLVCGSRIWTADWFLTTVLDGIHQQFEVKTVLEGEARGADSMAAAWAEARGIELERYPADWDQHGRKAGFVRNRQMLVEGKPDLVVAFVKGESRGTRMMIELARGAGKRVVVIEVS